MSHDRALADISRERMRQHYLKDTGRFKYTPSEVPLIRGCAMLTEEVGEVARAALAVSGYVQETLTIADVRTELVQVAAVAMAMVEGIDAGTAGPTEKDRQRIRFAERTRAARDEWGI